MKPYYETKLGRAFLGDAGEVMKTLPAESVNLIVTSPPFPLTFQKKKPYGTVKIAEFLEWFLGFAREFHRLLRDDGSLVIDALLPLGDRITEDLLSRRRQGVAQMLLGTLAEKRFEDITAFPT